MGSNPIRGNEIFIKFKFIFRGQSWHRGTKCDGKIDWLWARSPLEEVKYLFTFIFSFLRSVEAKRGAEFRHSIRHAFRTRRKVGNGVCLKLGSLCSRVAVCGEQREADLFLFFSSLRCQCKSAALNTATQH